MFDGRTFYRGVLVLQFSIGTRHNGNDLVSEWSQENVYSVFENLCYNCNNVQCSCEKYIAKNEIVDKQFQAHSIDEKITYMLDQKLRKII